MIDFKNYTSHFCVDWVQLEITLDKSSNPQSIRRFLPPSSYVEAINADINKTAKNFSFKLYDIKSKNQVLQIIENLNSQKSISKVIFTGIEIAHDYKSKSADSSIANEEHAEILDHLYQNIRNPASVNKRIAGTTASAVPKKNELTKLLKQAEVTIYIGNQKDGDNGKFMREPISQRLYNKIKDRQISLPPEKWCARFEITLQDSAMPFNDSEGFKKFKLETIAKHFYVNQLTDKSVKTIAEQSLKGLILRANIEYRPNISKITHHTIQMKDGSKKRIRPNKYPHWQEANKSENKLIRKSLTRLTKQLNKGL